jgi:peptidoglycan/LPS O-acetylase OafA/YrhL
MTSAFLDAVRVSAALGVVVSHVTSDRFSSTLPDLGSLGHACVAVFFVLSGYVVAWVADTREKDAIAYIVARFTRIYSVLVPAIVITIIADHYSQMLDPAFYRTVAHNYDPTVSSLRTLLFINQSYGTDHEVLSNGPIWSLGYEVPYYLVFACLVFLKSLWRVALISIIALIEGPAIWILFPIWLLGVVVYRIFGRQEPTKSRALISILMLAVLLGLSPLLAHFQTYIYSVEDRFKDVLHFGKSNQFIFFYTIGSITALLIVIVDSSSVFFHWNMRKLYAFIKVAAGSTFSIYLFHYPILVLIYCSTHYDRENRIVVCGVFMAAILACVLMSFVTEKRKYLWQPPISATVYGISKAVTRMRSWATNQADSAPTD